MALRTISLTMLGLCLAPHSQADDYYWLNKMHACVVESSTGLNVMESTDPNEVRQFNWTNGPSSFFVTIAKCNIPDMISKDNHSPYCPRGIEPKFPDKIWTTAHITSSGDFLYLKNMDMKWGTFNGGHFSDQFGSVIRFDLNGRFDFALLSESTSTKKPAWFTMTGQCTAME